jgi:hypothetical protein
MGVEMSGRYDYWLEDPDLAWLAAGGTIVLPGGGTLRLGNPGHGAKMLGRAIADAPVSPPTSNGFLLKGLNEPLPK